MARRRNSGRQVYQTDLLGAIRKFLPARGLPLLSQDGRVRWTARMLVVGAILMTWALEPTLADAFAAARTVLVTMYDSRRRPGKTLAGFLKALGRVSDRLLAAVTSSLREGVQRVAGRSWRFKAWVVMGVDGTRIECPRTAANEQAFGCAGKVGTGPQMWLTTVFHVPTGLPWLWRRGPGRDSERDHLKSMLEALPAGTLLLADAGYVGYAADERPGDGAAVGCAGGDVVSSAVGDRGVVSVAEADDAASQDAQYATASRRDGTGLGVGGAVAAGADGGRGAAEAVAWGVERGEGVTGGAWGDATAGQAAAGGRPAAASAGGRARPVRTPRPEGDTTLATQKEGTAPRQPENPHRHRRRNPPSTGPMLMPRPELVYGVGWHGHPEG